MAVPVYLRINQTGILYLSNKMAGRRYWLPKCGAMTRLGRPCRARPVLNADGSVRNGRCRNHAGCSTGPRTIEGHARCLAGRLKLYAARRAAGLPAYRTQAETRTSEAR